MPQWWVRVTETRTYEVVYLVEAETESQATIAMADTSKTPVYERHETTEKKRLHRPIKGFRRV